MESANLVLKLINLRIGRAFVYTSDNKLVGRLLKAFKKI